MSIELVIAALMAGVAILIGFAGPAPNREAAADGRELMAGSAGSEAGIPER